MKGELEFEDELIHHLESIGGTKQWKYEPHIKTVDDLWKNFRTILERNNADKLKGIPLTENEFLQVKSVIANLRSPYEAGRWIYGMNGVTQVEINRDERNDGTGGEHVFLTVFDQDQIGAGNTTYQVVNQIKIPKVLPGRQNRRLDTTLLINGLPIIHIEEKFENHDAKEALNQIYQYIDEKVFTGIFSTVQIFVGITPYQALYMANTDTKSFNLDFAFQWQTEKDSKPVYDWRTFCNLMLSIPMAHKLATNYMILDGDIKHKNLMVMRPYQVYATKIVIEKLKNHIFGIDKQEVGYIWHTTGSGKTISSFKTAWLASRLPNVDKVIFLVDRIALTKQTYDNYNAYDPDTDEDNKSGVINDTVNTRELARKLYSKDRSNSILVTSIQKMNKQVHSKGFKATDKHIVFIVDEAHRSTNGQMLLDIKKAFPLSAWVGYTGTPTFDENLTFQAFGEPLHTYTIREAIADENVLGFKVDFENTLPEHELKGEVLPQLLKKKYPAWNEHEINDKIARMEPSEVDELIDSRLFDNNQNHVTAVVDDIFAKWRNRSNVSKYSAILTVHTGGNTPSIPMAMMYYYEFAKKNEERIAEGKEPLRVTVTFSQSKDNKEEQLDNNRGLREVMNNYNKMFNTSFDDTTVNEYFSDVMSRLRGEESGPKLDLVIVVNQLLTGYDAKKVNTLYVDRTLSGANLIQAYSRTNRIDNHHDKPFGRIVNYRWPEISKRLMDEALRVYARRESASVQEMLDSGEGDIMAEPFETVVTKTREILEQIAALTDNYSEVPPSEHERQVLVPLISRYNSNVSKLKQDEKFDYDNPQELLDTLNISRDEEIWITSTLIYGCPGHTAGNNRLDFSELDFQIEHISEVEVNYDYIADLLAQLINDVHDNKTDIEQTYQAFNRAVNQLEDRKEAEHLKATADAVMQGEQVVAESDYPVQGSDIHKIVHNHKDDSLRQEILAFKRKWGIVDIATANTLIKTMLQRHQLESDDLNSGDELSDLLNIAVKLYQTDSSDEEIRNLPKITYRNQFREAMKRFADSVALKY